MDERDPRIQTYPQFQSLLRVEFARSRRYGFPLAVVAIQIDRLDHLRDLYGSPWKREILSRVVDLVQNHVRLSDDIGIHNDRILLALPHADEEAAQRVASRLSSLIGSLEFSSHGKTLSVSLSVGIAVCSGQGPLFYDALLKNAILALGDAQQAGGNEVHVFRMPAGDGAPT